MTPTRAEQRVVTAMRACCVSRGSPKWACMILLRTTRPPLRPAELHKSSMTYQVKEIFFTLQGEGGQQGRASVFCRFAVCNLWSGREQDRHKGPGGCSQWCDTDFVGTDGAGGGRFESAPDLAAAVRRTWKIPRLESPKPLVVCTGGEPLL